MNINIIEFRMFLTIIIVQRRSFRIIDAYYVQYD